VTFVRVEQPRDAVALVTLDRPERKNPLTFESYAELRDTFRSLVYARQVKAVVIAGAGGNFSSGGDVHEIIGPLTAPAEHGASATDAFHLVIPSLPGHGFSGKPTETGWDPVRIAWAWVDTTVEMNSPMPRHATTKGSAIR